MGVGVRLDRHLGYQFIPKEIYENEHIFLGGGVKTKAPKLDFICTGDLNA
jgi:hypothetical protein